MSNLIDWFSQLWSRLIDDYGRQFNIKETSLVLRHLINSLLIIFGAWLIIKIIRYSVLRFEHRIDRIHGNNYRRRIETITSLSRSVISNILYLAATFWILGEWGVNTDSLLVGTAVLGAALGFGAQGIVQDVITGLSMLAEDQLAVGDFVEIAGKNRRGRRSRPARDQDPRRARRPARHL